MTEEVMDDVAIREMDNQFGEITQVNPLLGFTGTLLSWETSRDSKYGGVPYTYTFEDLEDIKLLEGYTYEFPIATITVTKKLTKRGTVNPKSAYGIWLTSVNKNTPAKTWDGAVGGRYRVEYTPGHMMFNPASRDEAGNVIEGVDTEAPRSAWEIVATIDSSNGKSDEALDLDTVALLLLDGKTKQKFLLEANKDEAIVKDAKFKGTILNGTWLKGMVESGRVTVNDKGVHSVVG